MDSHKVYKPTIIDKLYKNYINQQFHGAQIGIIHYYPVKRWSTIIGYACIWVEK